MMLLLPPIVALLGYYGGQMTFPSERWNQESVEHHKGCFAFRINPEEYALKTELPEKASYSEALIKAISVPKMEKIFTGKFSWL